MGSVLPGGCTAIAVHPRPLQHGPSSRHAPPLIGMARDGKPHGAPCDV